MSQVINIVDDDNDDINVCEITSIKTVHPKIKPKCLNPDCKSSLNLIRASESIRRFYGNNAGKKQRHICQKCLKRVLLERNTVINLLKSGVNLFSKDISLAQKSSQGSFSGSDSDGSESGSSDQSEYEYDPLQIKGITPHSRSFSLSSALVTEEDKEELKTVLFGIIQENSLHKQLTDGQIIIQKRLEKAENEFNFLDKEYRTIERKLDKVKNGFYHSFRIDEEFVPSLEIGPSEIFNGRFELTEVISRETLNVASHLPPEGPLIRISLKVGEKVYIMKATKLSKWVDGIVLCIDLLPNATETVFQVQYVKDKSNKLMQKFVSARHLAYFIECPVRVPVGTRIIALVENDNSGNCFYVGVIAEIPTAANKYRYLVFFDDGYAQYVSHSNIRVIVQGSVNVWDDVEERSKKFIREYLETYPERPMVRLQKHNHIRTELEGNWFKAQVIQVDCSLAKMYFPVQGRYEWIYRGSTRLLPLFNQKINSKIKSEEPNRIIKRRTIPASRKAPVVEYINIASTEDLFAEPEEELASSPISRPVENQSPARKRTFQQHNLCSVPIHQQLELESQGYYTTVKCNITLDIKFTPHNCSFRCIKELNDILNSRKCSSLIKPLMLGWKRQICKKKKKTVVRDVCCYVTPCGRRLRTNDEILTYLKITNSNLLIDEFTFNADVSLLSAWEPTEKKFYLADITEEREYVNISCVNSIDSTPPRDLLYCSERVPSERVSINLDDNYLVCCSCRDDCRNKMKCECWQLTIDGASALSKRINKNLGYDYKRLFHQIPSGIYECNSRCSCKETCLNRVVQFPIKQKLQLFKTAKRGWGIRTLIDIPRGSFVCVYVGKVLTETEANKEGFQEGGDEYYANLDYIEVVESLKEGYESDAEGIEDEKESGFRSLVSSHAANVEDSNYEFKEKRRKKEHSIEPKEKDGQYHPRSVSADDDDDSNDSSNRRFQTFEPKVLETCPSLKVPQKSMREYYANDEAVYVMDAKVMGNIGRYFNHSCNSNLFVQNVFVDTHDPRFPWISFFAGIDIRAGMELTWDYNYEVGSVPDRIMYCYCGSGNCRGRLL